VKYKFCILISLMLSSCAVVDSSDFKYLDDEHLDLRPLLIIGAERTVEIALPKSLSTKIDETLFIQHERLELPYIKVLDFPYEWLWGGPAHKDKGLYLFELGFERRIGRALLSQDTSGRIQIHRERYENFDEGTWRDLVLERLRVVAYQSNNHNKWLLENMPTVTPYHEYFSIPVSDERELVIWFWYNEDWAKDHPEWFERRKALSRRILDTVKLSEPK
jgi:hypothetical protein